MLWRIAMVSTVFWLLGLASSCTPGGSIHILLVEDAKTFHPSGLRSGAAETPAVRAGVRMPPIPWSQTDRRFSAAVPDGKAPEGRCARIRGVPEAGLTGAQRVVSSQ